MYLGGTKFGRATAKDGKQVLETFKVDDPLKVSCFGQQLNYRLAL